LTLLEAVAWVGRHWLMKVCVIFNPVARGDKARRFRQQLAGLARHCALKATTGPGWGRPLAAEALGEGFETIVAAGGDGTLNEVINGFGDDPDGFSRVTLGVLPLGTVNVFAQELALPMNPSRAWEVVLAGRVRQVDVGVAEFTAQGAPVRRYFVQLAGAGMDARAVEMVNWEFKKRLGKFAYLLSAIQAIRSPLPKITVTAGAQTRQGELVMVGNGRFYGGRYALFPQADLTDGVLDVTVFPRVNWGTFLHCGWNVLTGQSPAAGHTLQLRGSTVRMVSSGPVPFQLEGDLVGRLPLTCSVLPGRLRVIVP
jgi:diacylglycerol kinase (ATP)